MRRLWRVEAALTPFRRDLVRRGAALERGSPGLLLRASVYHGVTLPVRRHLTLKSINRGDLGGGRPPHPVGEGASHRGVTPPANTHFCTDTPGSLGRLGVVVLVQTPVARVEGNVVIKTKNSVVPGNRRWGQRGGGEGTWGKHTYKQQTNLGQTCA